MLKSNLIITIAIIIAIVILIFTIVMYANSKFELGENQAKLENIEKITQIVKQDNARQKKIKYNEQNKTANDIDDELSALGIMRASP